MSIRYTGRPWHSSGIINAVAAQLKKFTFKPVNKMTVQFDPFHKNIKPTRQFLYFTSHRKVLNTNLACNIKTNVVCDRSEPTIYCELANGEKVLFKCNHLDVLDILKLWNKHISPITPIEDDPDARKIKAKVGPNFGKWPKISKKRR